MTSPGPVTGDCGAPAELRLALVCYGGASLAIYMQGVTEELHKLVVAAWAFGRAEDNPHDTRAATTRATAVLGADLLCGGARAGAGVGTVSYADHTTPETADLDCFADEWRCRRSGRITASAHNVNSALGNGTLTGSTIGVIIRQPRETEADEPQNGVRQ